MGNNLVYTCEFTIPLNTGDIQPKDIEMYIGGRGELLLLMETDNRINSGPTLPDGSQVSPLVATPVSVAHIR